VWVKKDLSLNVDDIFVKHVLMAYTWGLSPVVYTIY